MILPLKSSSGLANIILWFVVDQHKVGASRLILQGYIAVTLSARHRHDITIFFIHLVGICHSIIASTSTNPHSLPSFPANMHTYPSVKAQPTDRLERRWYVHGYCTHEPVARKLQYEIASNAMKKPNALRTHPSSVLRASKHEAYPIVIMPHTCIPARGLWDIIKT